MRNRKTAFNTMLKNSLHNTVVSAMLTLATLTVAVSVHADDLGKKSFELCVACHSLKAGENGLGPSLHDLFGRTAGTLEGFRFSGPMKRSAIVWDRSTLTAYLRNPQETVAGTRMPFSGMADETALQALVVYLEQATK